MGIHSEVQKLNGTFYELRVLLELLLNELRHIYFIRTALLGVQVWTYFFEEVKTWIGDVTNDATVLYHLLTTRFWNFDRLLSPGKPSCSLKFSEQLNVFLVLFRLKTVQFRNKVCGIDNKFILENYPFSISLQQLASNLAEHYHSFDCTKLSLVDTFPTEVIYFVWRVTLVHSGYLIHNLINLQIIYWLGIILSSIIESAVYSNVIFVRSSEPTSTRLVLAKS